LTSAVLEAHRPRVARLMILTQLLAGSQRVREAADVSHWARRGSTPVRNVLSRGRSGSGKSSAGAYGGTSSGREMARKWRSGLRRNRITAIRALGTVQGARCGRTPGWASATATSRGWRSHTLVRRSSDTECAAAGGTVGGSDPGADDHRLSTAGEPSRHRRRVRGATRNNPYAVAAVSSSHSTTTD
jgi:hypothetical protein